MEMGGEISKLAIGGPLLFGAKGQLVCVRFAVLYFA